MYFISVIFLIEIKRSSLRLLDEHLAYSLTKKGTTTKLFILQYEQTAKGNFAEMPIEELIKRFVVYTLANLLSDQQWFYLLNKICSLCITVLM